MFKEGSPVFAPRRIYDKQQSRMSQAASNNETPAPKEDQGTLAPGDNTGVLSTMFTKLSGFFMGPAVAEEENKQVLVTPVAQDEQHASPTKQLDDHLKETEKTVIMAGPATEHGIDDELMIECSVCQERVSSRILDEHEFSCTNKAKFAKERHQPGPLMRLEAIEPQEARVDTIGQES